jgi:hypothetical protein
MSEARSGVATAVRRLAAVRAGRAGVAQQSAQALAPGCVAQTAGYSLPRTAQSALAPFAEQTCWRARAAAVVDARARQHSSPWAVASSSSRGDAAPPAHPA